MVKKIKKKKFLFKPPQFDVLNFVVIVVVCIYVVSLIAAMVNPNYHTPVEVHALMGTMVGTILVKKLV